eukprot:2786124-Prymnesium_polylepis.1
MKGGPGGSRAADCGPVHGKRDKGAHVCSCAAARTNSDRIRTEWWGHIGSAGGIRGVPSRCSLPGVCGAVG